MDRSRTTRYRPLHAASRRGAAGVATLLALATLLLSGSAAAATPPPNDLIAGAAVVGGLPFEDAVDTDAATGTRSDPKCQGSGHSVWYSFTPTADVDLMFMVSADFDSTVAIFTGPIGDLTTLICSDAPGGTVLAKANVRHLIKVASWSGDAGGPMTIRLDSYASPTIAVTGLKASVTPITGDVVLRVTVTCTKAWNGWFDTLLLRQRLGDGTIVAGTPVRARTATCDGQPQTLRILMGAERAFMPGPARLVFTAVACGINRCAVAEGTPIIRIRSAG